MDIFFSTSEQKCQLCFRWIVHEVIGSISELCTENHCTCICGLLNYGTVCCLRGYMTLLQEENELLYIVDVAIFTEFCTVKNKKFHPSVRLT